MSAGGLNDSIKVSKRSEDAVERNLVKDRTPLSYAHLREDDAVYKQRIWREIDTREKMNLAFRYAVNEDNGNQRFISILINAIKGGVTAFDASDDRFTTPLTLDQAMSQFGSKVDHTPVQKLDDPTVIDHYCRTTNTVNLDLVTRYKVKEEVVFDKNTSRLYTRILGIAPMMPHVLSDGTSAGDGQLNTLFWLYYPDLRPSLAKYDCYNPKNFGARMSWEDLFESRMFSSYITKSTLDNPFDQYLKEKYAKHPLFVLLEGDAIKEKMFNYEQDLWSY
jgi:gliding motility associated protien GldN